MNAGILGTSRASGRSPARPLATVQQTLAGKDSLAVVTPAGVEASRRGGGRKWFFEAFSDFTFQASGFSHGTDGILFIPEVSGAGADANVATGGAMFSDYPDRVGAGLLLLTTGTASTGRAGLNTSTACISRFDTAVSQCESLISIPTLADATNDYVFRIGASSGNGLASVTVCWEYNRSNSLNWVGVTGAGAGHARVDTGIPVAAGKWIVLRIVWTAARADFFINETLAGTLTAGIQSIGSLRYGMHIIKTAGVTARTALVDYYYLRHDFIRERTWS